MEKKSFVKEPIGGFIYINPGSGPVENSYLSEAQKNMEKFCVDVDERARYTRGPKNEDFEGRFCFSMWLEGEENNAILIDMPGLPLEEVRYLGTEKQNIWDFPRLYVDGGSWVWKYAVSTAKDILYGVDMMGFLGNETGKDADW